MFVPIDLAKLYPNTIWKPVPDSNYIVNNKGVAVLLLKYHKYRILPLKQKSKYTFPIYRISRKGNTLCYSKERLIREAFGDLPTDYSNIEFLPCEIFVSSPEIPNTYMISNYGRVLSVTKGNPRINKGRSVIHGHPFAVFLDKGRSIFKSPRRLVAAAFVDNPEALKYVYSIDHTTTTAESDMLYYVDSITHMSNMGKRSAAQKGTKLQCIETGEVYDSYMEASRQLHISAASVYIRTINNKNYRSPKEDSVYKYSFKVISNHVAAPVTHIPCICNETGKQYPSVAAAAKDLGLSEKQVNRAVTKGGMVQDKYSFTKVGDLT